MAAQSGDEAAQRRLFTQRSAQVYRWAVLLGLRPSDAEDAAQEVLAIALRKINQCESDEGLTPWLYQITKNVVVNTRRRAWFRRIFLTEQPLEPAFEGVGSPAKAMSVRSCLQQLNNKQREVLILADVDGYTRQEIAKILKIPEGTVAGRLRLARKAFKACWEEEWSSAKTK